MTAKETRLLMGMPITVEAVDAWASAAALDAVFSYFQYVDDTFSTYKLASEITRINAGALDLAQASEDMQTVFRLAAQTKCQTDGYFDIACDGAYDPSGLVKGWAIANAAQLLRAGGLRNFYVEAGGDIQACGHNADGQSWRVGIRNPFAMEEIVKVLAISNGGVATSGTYVRGQHIRNPKNKRIISEIVSLTVIASDIYEADRFATAAFAMGRAGIHFIERLPGFEGYMIDRDGQATLTTGFERYVCNDSMG